MSRRAVAFWSAAGLLVYTQAGYPLVLAALARRRRGPRVAPAARRPPSRRCR